MTDRRVIHIKSRDEYEPWLSPASYEPEPVSLSDVLIGIGWAVCDLIAENWLAVALGFLLGLGVTVGLASVIGAFL